MNETNEIGLLNAKEEARYYIKRINMLCERAAQFTHEADMTADYIWGNCTLEELLKVLSENSGRTSDKVV